MTVHPDVASHPVREDKHGNDVSNDVAVAVSELRTHDDAQAVICDYHDTGRIQYFAEGGDVSGDAVWVARDCGFELDFATTRAREGTHHGYAEFVPTDEVELDPEAERGPDVLHRVGPSPTHWRLQVRDGHLEMARSIPFDGIRRITTEERDYVSYRKDSEFGLDPDEVVARYERATGADVAEEVPDDV